MANCNQLTPLAFKGLTEAHKNVSTTIVMSVSKLMLVNLWMQ